MKIELEIPQGIVEQCKKLNIAEENISVVFKNYCYDKLGYFVALTDNDFKYWCEDDDNICDYVEKTKKVLVEVKMVVEVTMDNNSSIEEAMAEMSENIPTCDLISSKGCIIGGKIDEYIVTKLK